MGKKLIVLLLSLLLGVSGLTACKNDDVSKNTEPGEITFWSTYATEKVLQNRTDLYDDVKLDAAVEVLACKGEYESAQVIMTAEKDVASYNAELTSDLIGPDGATFSKENIDLRHQKYIQVSKIHSSHNAPPVGWYPDALLPLETAVAYGENTIKAGENQGLYVTFNVPVEQKAGEYAGTLKIIYDGQEELIPVRLTVCDFTISQTTRSQSYFNLGFSQHLGELDSTQESWRRYVEELLKYRIAPSNVMRNAAQATDAWMEAYVDEAYDLVKNYDMSTINSPFKTGTDLSRFLVKLAQKSIEEKINLLEIVIVKGTDEPSINTLNEVKKLTESFHSGVAAAIGQFDGLKAVTATEKYAAGELDAFVSELKASAKKIPYTIALTYSRNDETNAAGIDTYCPQFDKYDTPESRALYDDQAEKGRWWYGCISPRPPYPTYHTEDTLISARSVGWMMSEYDIVGNLYWSATVYARWDGSTYHAIEDYYSGLADRFLNCNGDGYLFYPGAPYGLDRPVASLRLEAIRDGNEEEVLLYVLRAADMAAGRSPDAIQRDVSNLIYSGTKVRYNNISEQFAVARKAMIQLAMLAKSPAGVFITDVQDDNRGTITYKITAKKGYELKNAGTALEGTLNGDFTEYVVPIRMENDRNAISLSVSAEGKEYAFNYDLGGKVTFYAAEQLCDGNNTFSDGNATVTAKVENGKVRLDVGGVIKKNQNIRYTSAVLSSIGEAAQRLVLLVENPGEATDFRLMVRFKNNSLNTELYSGMLNKGENEIIIDLSGVNLKSVGAIQYADFYFSKDNKSEQPAKTVYLNGLTVYGA